MQWKYKLICFPLISRQSLVFLEIQRAPTAPIEANYLHRGNLKYEFSTDLLQTPLQLMKINNVQAQVSFA